MTREAPRLMNQVVHPLDHEKPCALPIAATTLPATAVAGFHLSLPQVPAARARW